MVTWEARLICDHTMILVWWISSARFVDSIVFHHGASRSLLHVSQIYFCSGTDDRVL
jgi:hypothetical protein